MRGSIFRHRNSHPALFVKRTHISSTVDAEKKIILYRVMRRISGNASKNVVENNLVQPNWHIQ